MNGIFITVRTASTRLPRKCLEQIGEKRVLDLVIERAQRSQKAHKIVVCTTNLDEDDVIVEIANEHEVLHHRGSITDKLDRWLGAAQEHEITNIVTFDADDLFCDPGLIDLGFNELERDLADFVEPGKICSGIFTYGMKVSVLEKVCNIKDTDDTEMMWPYFTNTGICRCKVISAEERFFDRKYRFTLDYPEDLEFFRVLFGRFDVSTPIGEIIDFLDRNPHISEINYFREQQWSENQRTHTKMKLKNG